MACVFLLPVAFSPAAHGRSKRLRLPGSPSCIIHCGCRPGNVVLLPSVPMLRRPVHLDLLYVSMSLPWWYTVTCRVPQPCGQFHWPKNHVECLHLTMLWRGQGQIPSL